MLETLKKNSFQKVLITSVILFVFGIFLVFFNAGKIFFATTGYVPFGSLKPEEIKNQLVDVELIENFGCYMEEYKGTGNTTKSTDLYYVIYTGFYDDLEMDYMYMTVKVPAKYENEMNAMTENTYNGILSDPVSFSGKIQELDDEEYAYFVEFWEAMGFSDIDIKEMTLPYYIDAYGSKVSQNSTYIVLFLAGTILIIWGIVRIIKGVNSSYKKTAMSASLRI